jgi:EAL domain-containing protein (putative c-di-GMP-specific phosphodiesterase class I)
VLVSDVERTREQLARLVGLGVRVAVDDFGTGYSALAYLRQFPIDIVKLDRQFVREIGVTPERATVAGAVIQLAHTLGHEVVAEGVEERHQVDALVRMGCDYLQGHHYAAALPPDELRGVVVTRRTSPPPALPAPV